MNRSFSLANAAALIPVHKELRKTANDLDQFAGWVASVSLMVVIFVYLLFSSL